MSSEKIFKTTLNNKSKITFFYLNATCFGLDIDHRGDKQMRSLKGRYKIQYKERYHLFVISHIFTNSLLCNKIVKLFLVDGS